MLKRVLLCSLLIGFPFILTFAQKQGQARIDSLTHELSKAKEDTNKVNLLDVLSFEENSYKPESGLKHGQDALALAEKLGWKKGIAQSYNSIGVNYINLTKVDMALECFEKALKINEETGSKKRAAQNLGNIALLYDMKSNYPKALEYLFKALKFFEELKDNDGITTQLTNIASIYDEEKNFPKAIQYDSIAREQCRKAGDKDGLALIIGNMANIYDEIGQKDKAMQYNIEAIKLYEELGNQIGIARNLGNLSVIYENKMDYYKALELGFRAMKINKEIGDQGSLARCFVNIGGYYLDIFNDSTPIKKGSLVPANKQACLKLAINYIQKAMSIDSSNSDLNSLVSDYQALARAQRASGDYKKAIESYIAHFKFKDSVFSMDSKMRIEKLTTEREVELKSKQIEIDKLEIAKKQNERVFFIAGIGALLIVIFFIYRNYKTERVSNRLLSKEKQKSEELLLNILPSEIAEELKQNGTSAARHFDDVTVLFTDFVNFTEAGERMTAQQLVGELHTCFKAFDDILGKYNIEKIKTVGDAYLAVSGLPLPNPDHARDTVSAAIEIRDFMQQRKKQIDNATFDIRIGIHTGSVVAGIVGVKKFAYDIWGDTVNTAARMEQYSESGKINISETTYQLVKSTYACEYRGKIEAKNKGVIDMYFVS